MFTFFRMLRATSGEWQFCPRCKRRTINWYRIVVSYKKRTKQPICAVCLNWKPWDTN